MKPNKRKLQALINACIKAHNASHKADRELFQYCQAIWWDKEPSESDQIVDGCLGGCGHSRWFDAEDFIREMDS